MQNIQCDPGVLEVIRARLLLDDVTRSFPRVIGVGRAARPSATPSLDPTTILLTRHPLPDLQHVLSGTPRDKAIHLLEWHLQDTSIIYTLTYARCATLPLACSSGVGQ